jgi:hypothetical protein
MTLSKKDQHLLKRLELPEYLVNMIRAYWDKNPENKGKSLKVRIAGFVGSTIGTTIVPFLLAGILSPLYIQESSWMVNLSIFGFWMLLILLLVAMPIMTLYVVGRSENEDAEVRESIMGRSTIRLLANMKAWKKVRYWLVITATIIACATQAHFMTAGAIVSIVMLMEIWRPIHRGVVINGLNKVAGIEVVVQH